MSGEHPLINDSLTRLQGFASFLMTPLSMNPSPKVLSPQTQHSARSLKCCPSLVTLTESSGKTEAENSEMMALKLWMYHLYERGKSGVLDCQYLSLNIRIAINRCFFTVLARTGGSKRGDSLMQKTGTESYSGL